MITIPSPVEGVVIERDLRNDVWQLSAAGAQFRLRPWTWGDRRRILECATAAGQFDSVVLLDALFDLLVEPQPELEDVSGLAYACLHLLGADVDIDLNRAEYMASSTFGWPPAELDRQPAAAVDRLLAQVPQPVGADVRRTARADWRAVQNPQAGPVSLEESGWTRIAFQQPDAQQPAPEPLPAKLDGVLLRMARAAGFSSATPDPGPRMPRHPLATPAEATRERPQPAPDKEAARVREPIQEVSKPAAERTPETVPETRAGTPEPARGRRTWDTALAFRLRNLAAPAEPADRTSTSPERFPGTARLRSAAPRAMPPAAENRLPTSVSSPAWNDSGGAVLIAAAPAPAGLDFPGTLVKVQWPEPSIETQGQIPDFDSQGMAGGFALSSLEEQMADVLERAVREAGIDLP